MRHIDLDRGVMVKKHETGMYIYMYMDKPGEYLNAFGKPINEVLAEEAGFEVERFAKEKLKRERMAEAMSAIEVELELAKEGEPEVIKEGRGYKVIRLALGNANVIDEDGNVVNALPIPEETALALFAKLKGE